MSIITKLKEAAADGPAPAGKLKLLADSDTNTYVVVDADGEVKPLGGAALPAGGTAGQVLTKTSDSATWADAPAGGAPAGTWMSLLPPDGVARDASIPPGEADPLASAAISNVIFLSGGGAQ